VGKFGTQFRSTYSASKHALQGYFDSLRSEVFDKGISINIICPGFIKTNVTVNSVTASGDKYGKMDQNQEDGMSAQNCAIKILEAIDKNKEEVLIGGKETYGVYLKRMFPKYFSKMIRKRKVV
jgi:short-subunit dehydrogenase